MLTPTSRPTLTSTSPRTEPSTTSRPRSSLRRRSTSSCPAENLNTTTVSRSSSKTTEPNLTNGSFYSTKDSTSSSLASARKSPSSKNSILPN